MEQALKLSSGEISSDDVGQKSLVQQNIELRKKLDEEHANYKRKLQAYQDGQQRQAQLVQKLQAKVVTLQMFPKRYTPTKICPMIRNRPLKQRAQTL